VHVVVETMHFSVVVSTQVTVTVFVGGQFWHLSPTSPLYTAVVVAAAVAGGTKTAAGVKVEFVNGTEEPRTNPTNPTTTHKFLLKIIAVYPVFTVRKTIVSRAAKAAIRERA
jgi:hypothetical protein